MSNGTPDPEDPINIAKTVPSPQPSRPQNTAQGNWAQLLQRLGPILMQMGQRQPPSPGTPAVPGVAPPQAQPPFMQSPGGMDMSSIKADPRVATGSLPMPIPTPERQVQGPTRGDEIFQSSLNPRNQAAFNAVQGVSQFVQQWAQRKDQRQHVEAMNASKALMQALDAKDYVQAESILNHHGKIFDKVFKGWLQKDEEAQKQMESSKKQKKPDPTVQGVETAIQQYLQGKSSQAPQPPKSLGGYYLPKAAPAQQAKSQQESSQAQALQQQPSLGIPGGALTPAEAAKLQTEMLKYQGELTKQAGEYQKAQFELKRAEQESNKAAFDAHAAQARGETAEKINQANLMSKNVQLDIERQKYTNIQAQLANIKARGGQAGQNKLSASYKVKFAAIDQAQQILNTMKSEKRDFTPTDIRDLQQHLKMAGATTLAGSLTKFFNNHWYLPDVFTKPSVDELSDSLDQYKQNLIVLTPAQSSEAAATGEEDTSNEDVITVSPEDLK
jgi:hypothetical protein